MWSRPWLRWLVPLAAVLAIAATALVAGSATADVKLPPRSAEQLLVDLRQPVDGFSGTVEQSADPGIPTLPGVSDHGSDFTSLLSGTHSLRVAYAAPDRFKVALLGELSERSITRDGSQVWTWSSRDNEVTHREVTPATADRTGHPRVRGHRPDNPGAGPGAVPATPQEAAQRFLSAVADTTEVSVATNTTVAGRHAYELILRPRDTRSLLSEVAIAIDGVEHVALRVQVFADDRPAPVASIGFTAVDFAVPAAQVFEFTPPPGAKVTEADSPSATPGEPGEPGAQRGIDEEPTLVGEGWTTVAVGRLPADLGQSSADPDQAPDDPAAQVGFYLEQLPEVSGAWGSGRLLAGTAFSVVITDDGRFAAGAVPPDLLYDALG